MGVPVIIGSVLPDAVLALKYNSVNDFSLFYWDDEDATVPTPLTGAVATIEVDATGPSSNTYTGVRVGTTNEMKFTFTLGSVTWDNVPFRAVLTTGGSRFVYASGKARVQK
jgi:hypothetical protein